jgi:alpha-L-arabinofuranosidase
MKPTTITFHSDYQIGPVDPRIFGGFLEHMGRAVYEGIYAPESVHANGNGFRADVLAALQRLQMTAMRYPGGNFASGYHWQDGVGSKKNRPTVRELAWQSIEPNTFGTEEFIELSRQMSWTPMLTVNLGTGTPEEARNWVEFCNAPQGTRFADLRSQSAPFDVKLWCLGNEMDGPWQLGHVPANQYAIRAQQAAKMMKNVDPELELVACGSSNSAMPTFIDWDWQVLDYVGDLADYISLHQYVGNHDNDTADYLAITNSIDQQIEDIDAVCRFVQAKHRSKKRAYLCFDEWNIWYKNMEMDGEGKLAPHLIEEVYNLEDALVVAGFLNSFIRHADVVKIANIAQIVNVIAPILTRGDEMLLQSIFYPFEMYTKRRTGIALQPVVSGPKYESSNYGEVAYLDTSAINAGNQLHVFITNRSLTEAAPVTIQLADRAITRLHSGEILSGTDPKAANSYENPNMVRAQVFTAADISGGVAQLSAPPLAVMALTFELASAQ